MTESTTTAAPGVHASGAAGLPEQGVLIVLPPIVRARFLVTRGGVEVVVTCPRCGRLHRHRRPGRRRAPCGLTYIVRTRRGGSR